MYEVFLNDRMIILAGKNDPDFLKSGLIGTEVSDGATLAHLIPKFLKNKEPLLVLTGQLHKIWSAFQSLFLLLPAAGGAVRSEKGFLFIYRRGFWDLPKGKIDEDETPEEAALREVREETGLTRLTILRELPDTWHIYLSPHETKREIWILKETKWFLMEGDPGEPLVPETTEDIEEAQWISVPELRRIRSGTYTNLKKVINSLL